MKELPPAFRTIPVGAPLLEALSEFPSQGGWVQAVGFVEDVELKVSGEGADVRRAFRGRYVLASLAGPLGGPYGVSLSRVGGGGVEVLAGLLEGGISAGVSAVCFSMTGARLGAEEPRDAVAPVVPAAPPLAKGPVAIPGRPARPASSFAARVGVGAPAPEVEEDEPVPERGDLVEHFAFGRAEVLSIEGERLVLRDLYGAGRIREIALDRLSVKGPLEHEGKRLFRLDKR
jgi:hypothetical protein